MLRRRAASTILLERIPRPGVRREGHRARILGPAAGTANLNQRVFVVEFRRSIADMGLKPELNTIAPLARVNPKSHRPGPLLGAKRPALESVRSPVFQKRPADASCSVRASVL